MATSSPKTRRGFVLAEEKPLSYWDRMEQVFSRCLTRIFGKTDQPDLQKMVEAGYQNPPQAGGAALRKESLEPGVTNLDIPQGENKELSEDEAIKMLMEKGYSEEAARRLTGMIFNPATRSFLATAKS